MSKAIFTKRTGSIYHSTVKRFRERKNKAGKVTHPARKVPYTLEEFRKWVEAKFRDAGPQFVMQCEYCGGNISVSSFCVDHDLPVGRGGSLALSNLALCCERCNCTKGGLTGNEFRQFMRGIATFPESARTDILRRLKMGGAYTGLLRRSTAERGKGQQ